MNVSYTIRFVEETWKRNFLCSVKKPRRQPNLVDRRSKPTASEFWSCEMHFALLKKTLRENAVCGASLFLTGRRTIRRHLRQLGAKWQSWRAKWLQRPP